MEQSSLLKVSVNPALNINDDPITPVSLVASQIREVQVQAQRASPLRRF